MKKTHRGTDRMFYEVDGDTVTTFQTANGLPDGRRLFENHQSVGQFKKLVAAILGDDALAKPMSREEMEQENRYLQVNQELGAKRGLAAAIDMAIISQTVGADIVASLENARSLTGEQILALSEQLKAGSDAALAGVEPLMVRAEPLPEGDDDGGTSEDAGGVVQVEVKGGGPGGPAENPYSALSWGDLRKLAAQRGINTDDMKRIHVEASLRDQDAKSPEPLPKAPAAEPAATAAE